MNELLEELVPRFDGPGDWDDVLRRARSRRPRRRLVLSVIAVTAALATASAIAVPLIARGGPKLPAAADRRNVGVVVEPSGRLLVALAAWKGQPGVCYVVFKRSAGCTRGVRGRIALGKASPGRGEYLIWIRFPSRRIVSAKVTRADGTIRSVPFRRFRTFSAVGPLKVGERVATLRYYDANGRVVTP